MKRKRGERSKLSILRDFVILAMMYGATAGAILGAIIPIITYLNVKGLLMSSIGFILGLIFGAPLGFICGVLLGFVTIQHTMTDIQYCRKMMFTGGIGTTLFAGVGLTILLGISTTSIILTLLACLTAFYISNQMVDWWLEEIGETKKKKREEIIA